MPDFTFKQSFPIADVINAAQRKAALEQQAKQNDDQLLMSGIQTIGQVGQGLVDKRMKVAQALALGKQFGIDENQAKFMDPDQILKIAAVNKGMIDADFLKSAMMALSGRVPTSLPGNPAVPAAAPAQAPPVSGAMLAGGPSAPAPMQGQNTLQPPSVSTGTVPVPIQAPPLKPRMVDAATAKMGLDVAKASAIEPVITRSGAEAQGGVIHGTHILPDVSGPGGKADSEYDKLENQVISRIVGIRGDKSLARTEEQRDASMQAFNTIAQIKSEHRLPNQLEYYDILGQMWKARTGASPTDQAIRDLDAKTFQGDLGKALQYFSGNAAPRTTEGVMNAIQNFADISGKQADKLHTGYMQSHLIKPKNMAQADFDRIVQAHRGQTFEEGTSQYRQPANTGGGLTPEEQKFIADYEAKNKVKT